MHAADLPPSSPASNDGKPWWRELTRYHWFVFVVAALGWLFDTMDQQLFNLVRKPAIRELLKEESGVMPSNEDQIFAGGIATAIFLIGWATGGIIFGILGDRIGRAKTMLLTILVYSIFTGISAASQTVWQFCLFRFLTGLGVGGEFAVGIALLAEVMPDRARTHAIGWLQSLSAIGNITAAVITILIPSWRVVFLIGTGPALLALLIRRRLKEPERWQKQASHGAGVQQRLGSMRELFGTPELRRNVIVGFFLAFAGVVGLWGIGFFSFDLLQIVIKPMLTDQGHEQGLTAAALDDYVNGKLGLWVGIQSIVQNLGGFFGIQAFMWLTNRTTRRFAFFWSFLAAMISTALTYMFLGKVAGVYDVFWMIPIMGFCQLSLFGGYAIYFPELFPTRLRSTGTSFCYNVGRFVAALGPFTLGVLTRDVFHDHTDPMRWAGLTMCAFFLIGLAALPFAPETKGKPLPE